jgi:hypothetical protein
LHRIAFPVVSGWYQKATRIRRRALSEVGGLSVAGCLVTSRSRSHGNRAPRVTLPAPVGLQKGANRAPRVRAEPSNRCPARGGLRLALGRCQPAQVPTPRGGLLGRGSLRQGRSRPEIRTTLEYPGQGEGRTFDAEGYLAVDERERRMEWGAEAGRDYSGWLTVANHGEGGSEVVVPTVVNRFGSMTLRAIAPGPSPSAVTFPKGRPPPRATSGRRARHPPRPTPPVSSSRFARPRWRRRPVASSPGATVGHR